MAVNEHRPSPADVKFQVMPGGTDSCATYVFGDEDHTLGNALRHVLMERSDVEFCGYSVPHPSEPKMNLRVQTTGAPALKVLKLALKDLSQLCDILDDRVEAEVVQQPND
ncbi:unnamed protein product [Choristocarpus tenellus]